MSPRHPLSQLTRDEFLAAREAIVKAHGSDATLFFKSIHLDEPRKTELVKFLVAEHNGTLTDSTPRPSRCAQVEYELITGTKHKYIRSVVDIEKKEVVSSKSSEQRVQPYYTM